MNNFEFFCPTKVLFGKGMIAELPRLIDKNLKILMTYGGGSIKKNGVYDQVMTALEGYQIVEFDGIEPNPRYETCMKAVELIKREGIDFILAVGGGSVLDGSKFIAAAARYEGDQDPFDAIVRGGGAGICDALPLASVITLPATGSEMNPTAVISKEATDEKLAFATPAVFPSFSIIDPESTFSLPHKQTLNGIVDTFVHTMEQYATYDVNSPLQDLWMLSLLRTLIQEAPKVLADPNDYEARANIFWCATCGLNFWMSQGVAQDWATHLIGHEITAFYGLDHGESLAIVMPRLLENQLERKKGKLAKLAKEVFSITEEDESKAALLGIAGVENFFKGLGVKTRLAKYGVDAGEAAQRVRERFEERGCQLGEHQCIDAGVSYEILMSC